jgi:predicted nucleic acid-binding protein
VIIYYLDASAWVKRYIQEAGSAWIFQLVGRQPALVSASLGYIEVLATLTRKRRAGEIDEVRFSSGTSEVERDWQDFVKVHLDAGTLAHAIAVVRQYALRGADTVHLASALLVRQHLGGDISTVVVVTADGELKIAAQAAGFNVLDPVVEVQNAAGGPQR